MKYPAYPKYKKSGVEWLGDVPAHWEVKRIKHLGVIRYGLGEPPEYVDDGLPFIRATDINRGKVEMDLVKKIRPEDVPWGRNPQLKLNEILVVRSGAYTGDSAIITSEVVDCIAGYDMVYTARKAYAAFVAWVLLSKYMLNGQIYLERMRAAQPHLNAEELGNFIVLLPPHPEQQAIAAFLDRETGRIDSLIGKKQKLIELLKEKRTALISRAVTKGLNPKVKMKPSGVKWLGDVPEHWEVKKIKHLTKVISKGTTPSTEGFEILEDGEIRFIKAENIVENGLSFLPEFYIDHKTNAALGRSILEENDILIVIAGATIGKVAVLEKRFLPANTNQAVCFIRLREKQLSKLVWYYMQSDLIKNLVAINSVQSAQPNISMGLLKELVFPMPPLTEYQAVAAFLDQETGKIDLLIAEVEAATEKLKEYRTALISAAVTGKINVSTGRNTSVREVA